MLASCAFQPGDFVHTLGDAHVYSNHLDALEEQVTASLLILQPALFTYVHLSFLL